MFKFIIILIFIIPSISFSNTFEGFVETKNGNDIFVKYQQADPGKETFVFVNGLVYEIERWEKITKQLKKKGFGVLLYEFEGQNRTFKRSMDLNNGKPEWIYKGLSLNYFAEQLNDIVENFQIERMNLIALSYGSSIAATFSKKYEEKVKKLVFMSPLVIPLENYDRQGRQFHQWLNNLEYFGPIGNFWSNYYYDLVYKWYYKEQPSSRHYDFGPWEKDYYRSVFHQVKAVRKFDLRKTLKKLTKVKTYFLTASKEDPIYLPDQQKTWEMLPVNIKGSLIHIKGASHAIPDTTPKFTALYLSEIVMNRTLLNDSKAFNGYYSNGKLVLNPKHNK